MDTAAGHFVAPEVGGPALAGGLVGVGFEALGDRDVDSVEWQCAQTRR